MKGIMEIKYSDALLIQTIFHSEQENHGSKLSDIIAYADYVDHAIMTFDEFKEGLNNLLQLELVIKKDKNLAASAKFKEWWNLKFDNKKRIYAQKELELIQSYLKKLSEVPMDLFREIQPEAIPTEDDFRSAKDDYISKMNCIADEHLQKLNSKSLRVFQQFK